MGVNIFGIDIPLVLRNSISSNIARWTFVYLPDYLKLLFMQVK